MSFLISDAVAAAAAAHPSTTDSTSSLLMVAVIFVLFYFMMIRPQAKRAKEHKNLLSGLKKGDEVVTSSGILAKIVHIGEQYVKVAVAENLEFMVQRAQITAILPKGTLKSL
jgi:preprotein translocase subunit YajC